MRRFLTKYILVSFYCTVFGFSYLNQITKLYFILKKMTPWTTISAPLLFNNKCFKQVLLNLIPRNMLKHYQKIRPPYCILTFRERAVS